MNGGSGRQLVLDLPHRPALSREDFLVSESNAAAVALVDRWPDWPAPALLLVGPPGSGKSHLVEVWRQRSKARRMQASNITIANVPSLFTDGALAVEDAGPGTDQAAVFHLMNPARQQGATLLITARNHPQQWGISLADLLSRLRATPAIEVGAPDDHLLRGVLVKLFADRQLGVEEAVISYLVSRMPRSLDAARTLVAEIDARALQEKAEVTRPFAARVLAEFTTPELL